MEDSLFARDAMYARMAHDEVMLGGVRDAQSNIQKQRAKAKEKAEKLKERRG